MGTMVTIDYENGDSIMTDGLESTLVELGIQTSMPQAPSVSSSKNNKVDKVIEDDVTSESSDSNRREEILLQREKPLLLADARERMRKEAASEVSNSWMNMASYISKKVIGRIVGSE